MKRKIIKLAEQTLVVSLPKAWVDSQQLQKGDQLEATIKNEQLVLQSEAISKKSRVELDIAGLGDRVLRWKLSSYHKQGYDEIELLNYTQEQYATVEDIVGNLFLGFLIQEKTEKRIVLLQVAQTDVKEFDATLRRAFRQLQQMVQELAEALATNNKELLAAQQRAEQHNNKMTNFCERLLNKNLLNKEKGHFWYVLAWNLEKCADTIKYIAAYYVDAPAPSEQTQALFPDIQSYTDGMASLPYDFSYSKLEELNTQKKKQERLILEAIEQAAPEDRVLLHYLHTYVLQLADFAASTIAVCEE